MNRQDILNRTERFFRTDIRYVGKNGFWVLLGQGAAGFFGLLLSIAFANLLSPENFGVYKYIFAVAGILTAFRLTGLRQVVIQATARGAERTVFPAMWLSLKWSGPMIFIGSAVTGYYWWQENFVLAAGIAIVTLCNAILTVARIYLGYVSGKHNFKQLTIETTIVDVSAIVATIVTVLLTSNVIIIVSVNIVSSLLLTVWFAWRTLRTVDKTSPVDHDALRFGKHLGVQNGLNYVVTHLDKIILFQWVGSVELAIYAFSQMLPTQLSGAIKAVLSISVPKFSKLDKAALRKSIRQKVVLLSILVSIPVVIYILLAPFLFQVLFPAYLDAIVYSQIIAAGVILIPAGYLFTTYFTVRHNTKVLYHSHIFLSIVKLIVLIVLTYSFGLAGAIASVVVARVLSVAVFAWFYARDAV